MGKNIRSSTFPMPPLADATANISKRRPRIGLSFGKAEILLWGDNIVSIAIHTFN